MSVSSLISSSSVKVEPLVLALCWLSLPSFCHSLSSAHVSLGSLWISLVRSYLRVSLWLHPLLSFARMLEPCFQGLLRQGLFHQVCQAELSGTVILSGTLPRTPFLCLSAVSSPFWSPFLSSAIAPWSVSSSCRVGCLVCGTSWEYCQ